jgi:hypothetical protein
MNPFTPLKTRQAPPQAVRHSAQLRRCATLFSAISSGAVIVSVLLVGAHGVPPGSTLALADVERFINETAKLLPLGYVNWLDNTMPEPLQFSWACRAAWAGLGLAGAVALLRVRAERLLSPAWPQAVCSAKTA